MKRKEMLIESRGVTSEETERQHTLYRGEISPEQVRFLEAAEELMC